MSPAMQSLLSTCVYQSSTTLLTDMSYSSEQCNSFDRHQAWKTQEFERGIYVLLARDSERDTQVQP